MVAQKGLLVSLLCAFVASVASAAIPAGKLFQTFKAVENYHNFLFKYMSIALKSLKLISFPN